MDDEYALAVNEWDLVAQIQDENLALSSGDGLSKFLTYREVFEMLCVYARQVTESIVEFEATKGVSELGIFSRFLRYIFGPSVLSTEKREQTRLLISLSTISLDNLTTEQQFQLLSTLYFNLLDERPPSRFGAHWQNIGFQGNDPGTDLRGVGVFGLLLLITISEDKSISQKMFKQSTGIAENFPFCTCLLTLCKSTLRLLKAGDLNFDINERPIEAALQNSIYILFGHFEQMWFDSPISARNVSLAGELSRKIDKKAKSYMKTKIKVPNEKSPTTKAEIDILV